MKTQTTGYPTYDAAQPGQLVVVETQTTETTETESEENSGGIVSGTVDAAGAILALPFRAAGGLIDIVF